MVIGNANLTLGRGNVVRDNTNGISARSNVRVVGNTAFNHSNGLGMDVRDGAVAISNVVFDNSIGIFSFWGSVQNNRIYHNSDAGVLVDGGVNILGNVIYSNAYGVRGSFSFGVSLTNNLIYANSTAGMVVTSASVFRDNLSLVNNTFAQTTGDAIRVGGGSRNVRIRNSIFVLSGGYAYNVAPDSQVGFESDFNNFFMTGTGKLANWQNVDRPTLAAWRTTAFTDVSSLSVDPRFVDMDGADNTLGYVSPAADGRDDDFHLASTFGSFVGASFAPVATNNGTGVPTPLPGNGPVVVPGILSPLIDRGSPADLLAVSQFPTVAL